MPACICSMHLKISTSLQQASAKGSLVSLQPADAAISKVLTTSIVCLSAAAGSAIYHALLQAAAEGSLMSLKEQLAGMTEVHSQLEEAVKALQGKLELRDQELEVLNMELLAKDKVAALHQAIRDQMALQMPLPQVSLPSVIRSVCCLVMPGHAWLALTCVVWISY